VELPDEEWYFQQVEIDAYHTFDAGIEQILCKKKGPIEEASLNLYVKNLLNATYYDTSGFPAADRTVGATLRLSF
jgi:iron complex outermembrane receptor protein